MVEKFNKFNKFNKFGKRILFLILLLFYFTVVFSNAVFSEENSCKDNILDYFYVENTGSDNEVTLTANSDYSSIEVSFALKLIPKENAVKRIKDVKFLSEGFFNNDFIVDSLTSEKNNDEYILHLKLSPKSFDFQNLKEDVDKNVGLSVLITFVDINDNEKTVVFCLPSFSVKIILDENFVPKDLVDSINSAKKTYENFKKLDSGFKILETTYSLMCNNKQKSYEKKVSDWNTNCSILKSDIKKSLLGEEVNVDEVCNVKKDSFEGSNDEEKTNNCKERFSFCKENYNDVLKSEKEMLDVCMRVSCNPVYTKEEHSKRYFDFLGINYCENNIDSEKCNDQYKRIENTKCEFLDVNTLDENKNLFNFKNSYEQQVCGAPGEIKTLIDPSSSIVGSAACMCIPSLSSYISNYRDLYENYVSCLEGSSAKKASECLNVNYIFLCENALDFFSCGYLDLASYSGRISSFLDENNKAYVITNNIPTRINNKIKNDYSALVSYDFNFNTGSLKNAVCRTAFGDENIDWGKILLDSFSYNFEASLTSGVNFCDVNKKLDSSCYCGTQKDFNEEISNSEDNTVKPNCGENYICTFEDNDKKFYCKEENEVNIPNNKENEKVEEKVVLRDSSSYDSSNTDMNNKENENSEERVVISKSDSLSEVKIDDNKLAGELTITSDNSNFFKKVPYCKKESDGITVLSSVKKIVMFKNDIISLEYNTYYDKRRTKENLFPSKYLIDYCDKIEYDCEGNSFIFKGTGCYYEDVNSKVYYDHKNIVETVPITFTYKKTDFR